jgi:hypothetical protein
VLGTYFAFLLILGLSALVGQAIFAICGRRTWSRLSPAVGLSALCPIAWGAVQLPGEGTAALIVIGAVALASAATLRGRLDDLPRALRTGVPLELCAVAAASLPFIVAGRFGILGTGLDPDMSQHLLVTSRLVHGEGASLIAAGYPLGPHSLVTAISAAGPSLVHAFDGLALAVAVASCLAPLALLWRLDPVRRIAGCLLVGLSYMGASYLVQGAFKESIEALVVLAFAVGLHQISTGELLPAGGRPWLRAAPLAVLGIGAVYCYSFPGLLWLGGAAVIWAAVELAVRPAWRESLRGAVAPTLGAIAILLVASAPEIGRMADFASYSTFDPKGAGLGNLFNRISPLEGLGIWPSGDFRVEPGGGFAPAFLFWLGAALAAAALAWGLVRWLRRREVAVPAALAAAGLLILYALVVGTAYQEAKAIAIAAPLAMLVAVRPLLEEGVPRRPALMAFGAAFVLAAGASTALALVNGPVGPSTYSPKLTELRPVLGGRSTMVLAPSRLLDDEHGRDYIVWELRGGRVCVGPVTSPSRAPAPVGVSWVITPADVTRPPFTGLRLKRRSGPYALWERTPLPGGVGGCPLIAPGGARANPASG